MEQEIKFYIYAALIFFFIVFKVIGKKKNSPTIDADNRREAAEQMRRDAERRRQAAERARNERLHSLRLPIDNEEKQIQTPHANRKPSLPKQKPQPMPAPILKPEPFAIPEEGVRVTNDSPAPMKDNGPTKEEINEHRRKWRIAILNSEILQPKF